MYKMYIQLTPALTDFKGPTIFVCYRRIFVIANIKYKEKLLKGPRNGLSYRRISVTGGSVISGFNCIRLFDLISHWLEGWAQLNHGRKRRRRRRRWERNVKFTPYIDSNGNWQPRM